MRAVSLFRFVLQIVKSRSKCTLPTQGLLCYNTDQLVSEQSRVCFISLCGLRLMGHSNVFLLQCVSHGGGFPIFESMMNGKWVSVWFWVWVDKNFCPLLFCPVARSKQRPPPPLLFNGVLSATLFPCLWRLPQRNFPCRASSPQRGLMGSHEQGAACQTLALLPHD